MIRKILVVIVGLQFNSALAQESNVEVPDFKDKYCNYVKLLEGGKTNIDYTDFRNSFLESKQFNKKGGEYDSLKTEVFEEIKNKNYQGVIRTTKAMLSIDYTSLFAHKYLQQTYKIIGDSVNKNKYHDIEFGLLNSITRNGDGKSCETGWPVTQIEEEYFILRMLGATLQQQSINSARQNMCDKMIVKMEDGEMRTYFFEANKVFEQERKIFGK